MTEGTFLRYATAGITFALGAANTLFGAHFQVPTIVGDFTLGTTLIIAEILAIRGKQWGTAAVDTEKLIQLIIPLVAQFISEMPKSLSNVNSTGLKNIEDSKK